MPRYYVNELVTRSGSAYACILEHDSSTDSAPGTGASWETYWVLFAQGGEVGSQIFTGDGAPSDALGINGDFYLNNLNGDYYKKASGTWGSPEGNLSPGSGETNTISNDGGGTEIAKTKDGVDFPLRTLNGYQMTADGDVISLVVAAPGPNYVPPSIKYYDTGNITIPAGKYWPLGWRLDGQYQDANYVPWTVASPFQVDVDLAGNLIGGDVVSSWYSVFLTSASTVLVLPFIRAESIDYTTQTNIHPGDHNTGLVQTNTFVSADDVFNTYRLVSLTMGTYHGSVYEISDTVDGSPDAICVAGNVTAEMTATQWFQMIPPSGTDCLYLGSIRFNASGDLRYFCKDKWDYAASKQDITANAGTSAANTDLGPIVPPTATKLAASFFVEGDGNPIMVQILIYQGTSGTTLMNQFWLRAGNGGGNVGLVQGYNLSLTATAKVRNMFQKWITSWVAATVATIQGGGYSE